MSGRRGGGGSASGNRCSSFGCDALAQFAVAVEDADEEGGTGRLVGVVERVQQERVLICRFPCSFCSAADGDGGNVESTVSGWENADCVVAARLERLFLLPLREERVVRDKEGGSHNCRELLFSTDACMKVVGW